MGQPAPLAELGWRTPAPRGKGVSLFQALERNLQEGEDYVGTRALRECSPAPELVPRGQILGHLPVVRSTPSWACGPRLPLGSPSLSPALLFTLSAPPALHPPLLRSPSPSWPPLPPPASAEQKGPPLQGADPCPAPVLLSLT